MKVKCLERFSIGNNLYLKDEVREVPDDVGVTACTHGWAEDVDGKIPTGERSIHPKVLKVEKVVHRNKAAKAGG